MTDASQEQQSQQKWGKFADRLRHSVDGQPAFVADSSSNGLKSPVSDEQQSDLSNDPTVDESSSGMADDGFEVVTNKRNRNQRTKPLNGNVWSGAAKHLNELHSTSSSSSTTAHSANSTQPSKLRVAPALNASKHNVQNRNSTTKNTQNLARPNEDRAPDEQDTSNSSDSAFAENQSPSHGSSNSLHFIGASENHNFSDSVALSDDEKWPELNVATKNDPSIKSTASPVSPKESETKSLTPVEEKQNPLEKDAAALNKRSKAAQWKRMDVEIVYNRPNEKKHGSSKRNFRSHGNPEHEPTGHRHSVGSSYKRRPQSRKSNVSSSDVELQNNNENKKTEDQPEQNEPVEQQQHSTDEVEEQQAQVLDNSQQYSRRDNRSNEQNARNHRNNNGYRQDRHYSEYNRKPHRNQRHSVPNLFQCRTGVPVYFMSQDYGPDAFIQQMPNAQTAPAFIYPNVGNVLMQTAAYPDMNYANVQYVNEYGQQNVYPYRTPYVQVPVIPQNAPFINTSIPTTIPESSAEQVSVEVQQNNVPVVEQSLDDELSQLLRRVFIDETNKSLRDLTDNLNIIAQLNYYDRCLILRCQMQFYFSPNNLAKDLFLRSHMDEEGFVALGLFLTFPRIKNLALDSNTIIGALATSQEFELRMNQEEVKIRAKTFPQEWVSSNNANNSTATSSTIVASPQADSAASVNQTKRPSQATNEDVTVDDIRARLIQGRSKQSPASSEHANEQKNGLQSPASQTGESQPTEEVNDQWTVCNKKKTRQPSENGITHKPESNVAFKPPSGKSPRNARQ